MTMCNRRTMIGGGLALLAAQRAMAAGSGMLDVAYVNARAWTGAARDARTDAIGTVGNIIAAVGAAEVKSRIGPRTRVVDLHGAFVVPGMTDCHTHFVLGSLRLSQVKLEPADTRQKFVDIIAQAARALPAGKWLQGGGWDADRWGGALPTRAWIDAATPDTPVAVSRYDLHMILMNSAALKAVGIDRNTPDIPGGVIERDAAGEPTGILKDEAKNVALSRIPPATDAQIDAAVSDGIALGLSKGVTRVHCTEIDWRTFYALERRRARREGDMRFYVYTPLKDWAKTAGIVAERGHGDDWFQYGMSKVVFDGSLGSRTALFYEPYLDDPSTHGIMTTKQADMQAWMLAADKAGMQVTAHAIGDEANDIVLDTMALVARTNGARDRRFRVEHAQTLSAAAVSRFARQDVIASVQPYHAIDDGRWAGRRIGSERLTRTFAFGSLVRSGAHVCMGSDWPVAPLDPLTGIAAAVLRETLDGKNPAGWYPAQRLSVAQAIAGYTREAAYASFADGRMGRIARGFLADLVVLDRDLFTIDPETILRTKVLRTIVDGEQRFGA